MSGSLLEFTYGDLRGAVQPKIRARSKKLPSGTKFVKFDKKSSSLIFSTESQTYPGTGLKWKQKIKLVDLQVALDIPDDKLKLIDRVRLAIYGDLKVDCGCPSFLYYGYRYILTQLDSVVGKKEKRIPKIRNPNLEGTVCKHLDNALYTLPFIVSSVVKALK